MSHKTTVTSKRVNYHVSFKKVKKKKIRTDWNLRRNPIINLMCFDFKISSMLAFELHFN